MLHCLSQSHHPLHPSQEAPFAKTLYEPRLATFLTLHHHHHLSTVKYCTINCLVSLPYQISSFFKYYYLISQFKCSMQLQYLLIYKRMSDDNDSKEVSEKQQSQQQIYDRINKKYKTQALTVNLNQATDITTLALNKYDELKKNYNFISFQEAEKKKKVTSGQYEKHQMPIFDFNQNMYQFKRDGYCANPNADIKGYVFSSKLTDSNPEQQKIVDVKEDNQNKFDQFNQKSSKNYKKQLTKQYKNQRDKSTNALDYMGPWAGYGQKLENGAITEDQKRLLQQAQQKKKLKIQQAKKQQQNFEPYSTFHWGQYVDYKGKSYLEPPVDFKPQYGKCYIPQKCTTTWTASQKAGFQVAKFFPKSGHFILTGTAEGKVLLFDVIRNRQLVHTYVGHTKAVRDIQFSNDGKHFLSCAFDGVVQYWDTQYGKVLSTYKLKRIPFSVRFHPSPEHQNIFLCGSGNRKIMQFDLNTGKKQMQYNQHLGTVNTITFIEQNKFVTSSDDKKLFVWEFNIPVVTKHVSEADMHPITSTAVHPSGQYFAGQSSDNQIIIFQNKGGNFRRIKAKNFSRHLSAGYACGIDFSHDGQFLISGDEKGRIFFYDWKTCKLLRTFDAHPSICIGVQWHPSDPTTVLTCGWEGLLKLWQGK